MIDRLDVTDIVSFIVVNQETTLCFVDTKRIFNLHVECLLLKNAQRGVILKALNTLLQFADVAHRVTTIVNRSNSYILAGLRERRDEHIVERNTILNDLWFAWVQRCITFLDNEFSLLGEEDAINSVKKL